jgi:dTDP-4-dehydrorhamnose 3,5-epimerase
MLFHDTPLDGLKIVELEPRSDDRGSFARIFCVDELTAAGLDPTVVQANMASTNQKGTIRGLHFQHEPFGEAKLFRAVAGAIFDVAVDVRPDSPTCGQWYGAELSAANGRAVFVPPGFAHGYQALEDNSTVVYFVSQRYNGAAEDGRRWDDPAFDIAWPMPAINVSEKDQAWPLV